MGRGDDQELRQSDLSNLRVQEMTPRQRAELRRRYVDFVSHFDGAAPTAAQSVTDDKRARKWIPGAKAERRSGFGKKGQQPCAWCW